MLRNLLDEVMRRRLWPIAVVALLVGAAAPLLFLKPTAQDAPPASMAVPAEAPAGELPARAQRLLAGSRAAGVEARRRRSRRTDPFQAPPSYAGSTSKPAGAAPGKDKPASAAAPSGALAGAAVPTAPGPIAPRPATPASVPRAVGDDDAPTPVPTRLVDVRFGKRIPARLQRRIPRLQTFLAEGRIVAVFVKYSPRRRKAVFAIAPGTLVDGQIDCRRKEGLCRYIDIPAGKGVRLITRGSDGTPVSRRLDVVRIVRPSQARGSATVSSTSADGTCLLGKMLALGVRDVPPAGDACKG